jgi:hypothetical protein
MVQPPKIACHARKIPPFLYEPEKHSLIGLENCWAAANNKIHRRYALAQSKAHADDDTPVSKKKLGLPRKTPSFSPPQLPRSVER